MEYRIWQLTQMFLACMISLICFAFLPLITISEGTLLCGDFNSNSFSYLIFIILLINSLQVCGAFPLLVCTNIKLGHRIRYENPEGVNVTKQSFWTACTACSTELFFFYFESVSSHVTCYKYIICIDSFLLSYFNSIFFLHGMMSILR